MLSLFLSLYIANSWKQELNWVPFYPKIIKKKGEGRTSWGNDSEDPKPK